MQAHQTSEKTRHDRNGQDYLYVVTGRWPFHPDMLRRDGSEGATDEDKRLIAEMCADHAPDRDFLRKKVEITLVIPNAGRHMRPNVKRWESFGWAVVGEPGQNAETHEKRMTGLYEQAMAKLNDEEREAMNWFNPPFRG